MTITTAVISAGGFGSRLRPLTDAMPKPMIAVHGKPLLEWNIEQFKRHGVKKFFLTLHYLPQVIQQYFGDGSSRGIHIEYVIEKKPLGSGGAVKLLEQALPQQFFYLYGDTFSLVDYTVMAQAYAKKEKPLGMERVARSDEYSDADTIEMDAASRMIAFHPKPHTKEYPQEYRLRGVFILEKDICEYLQADESKEIARDVISSVIADGKNFYGYECADFSKGIDTAEKLHQVEAHLTSENLYPWW